MRVPTLSILIVAALNMAAPAQALCSGESMAREFWEADRIVRARLVSQIQAWSDEPSAAYRAQWGDGAYASLYEFRVSEGFNGTRGGMARLFQEHNSGQFPIDIDKDYLLFLHNIEPSPGMPAIARGATYVRYTCGQSKPWDEVHAPDLAELRRLAGKR
jgi:hypothetical protein